ncbi:MAG: lactate permease LctP family transporter [Fusobacterium sp. JB021]|nr:lactate permease LctP family transporter [Fusobacterium sp. JB020]MDP0492757.1 lactate permease LctP family transporter [Fusobacterium sp. JB021]MDP0507076.1 lactate permease LctP family transporter [Fusobacterium sp. JB019]
MFFKFILAVLPIIWLIIGLSWFKMSGHKACPIALLITTILSLIFWKMPFIGALTAALEGVALAIWPICLTIVSAVFVYNIIVHTKNMEIIKAMLTKVSVDKRVLVLIIAWGFGGFMEGMAGFGTAVAIPASILYGLGVNPVYAAAVCMLSNTTPTICGSIGIPAITAGSIIGVPAGKVALTAIMQSSPIVILTPFILVITIGRSFKALKGMFWVTLISGVAFLIPEYFVAKFIGPELPVVIGALVSMAATILAGRIFVKETEENKQYHVIRDINKIEKKEISFSRGILAWLPFILILCLLLLTSTLFPMIHNPLAKIKTAVQIYKGVGASKYVFTWIATPGIIILIAGFIGGSIQKASFGEMFEVLIKTLIEMKKTIITIVSVIATAKIMGYSGMIGDIATLAVAVTGSFYPLIAPFVGSIVTFVAGSATPSVVLFTGLQAQTAKTLGIPEVWLAAINICGAVSAKAVSPQSIAIGVAAVGIAGEESRIFNIVIKYYFFFMIILGVIAYVFKGIAI